MNPIRTLLRPLVQIEDDEFPAFLWSFAWFFCLLFGYYVIRPIRETMAASGSAEYMNRLFIAVFIAMLIAVPAYSWLVGRFGRRKFVPIVYRFFAVWLLFFSYALHQSPVPSLAVGCTYFVWVSVFNLFVVSIFWSVLADSFSSAAGKRLFGFIAAGGSLGGLCSSIVVSQFSERLGNAAMLLIPVLMLELSLFCFRRVARHGITTSPDTQTANAEDAPTGGGIFEGMIRAFSSPYLFGICMFMLLGKFCATTIYVKQMHMVETQIESQEEKTALFAKENSATMILTFAFQAALTGYLMRFCGLPFALTLMPVVMTVALLYIAGAPSLLGMFTVQVIQRAMAYGLAEPAKAVLFTVVSREDKYKTKSFVDTVIFRGGDVAASSLEKALAKVSVNAAAVMVPATVVWCAISWFLGLQQRRLAAQANEIASSADIAEPVA